MLYTRTYVHAYMYVCCVQFMRFYLLYFIIYQQVAFAKRF